MHIYLGESPMKLNIAYFWVDMYRDCTFQWLLFIQIYSDKFESQTRGGTKIIFDIAVYRDDF